MDRILSGGPGMDAQDTPANGLEGEKDKDRTDTWGRLTRKERKLPKVRKPLEVTNCHLTEGGVARN